MLKNQITLQNSRRELLQAKWVFYLFVASLGMFFLATITSYCLIRTQAFQPIKREYAQLELPWLFWPSTALLIMAGIALQRSVWLIRRERMQAFRRWLTLALLAAILFVAVQVFAMRELIEAFRQSFDGTTKAYGLCFTLALVHALHVLAGIVFIVFVFIQSHRGRYDHERHWAVDNCAGYWHFLDVVWFVMLAAFLITK